ncbi:MAG: hypothetical protein ACRCWQ_06040 [Bacilli bacterium]
MMNKKYMAVGALLGAMGVAVAALCGTKQKMRAEEVLAKVKSEFRENYIVRDAWIQHEMVLNERGAVHVGQLEISKEFQLNVENATFEWWDFEACVYTGDIRSITKASAHPDA